MSSRERPSRCVENLLTSTAVSGRESTGILTHSNWIIPDWGVQGGSVVAAVTDSTPSSSFTVNYPDNFNV